jgi:hypothetical protein
MSQAPELAPSETRDETPNVARVVGGFFGLLFLSLGVASVIFDQYGRGVFGALWGYVFSAVGLALLLYHSVRDTDPEVRRVYGAAGIILLVMAVIVGVFPAKPDGASAAVPGQLLLPWGALLGSLSLLFLVPFARNETNETYQSWAQIALLGTGGLLCLGAVLFGLVKPELLAGPGAVLGVLGVLFLAGYFSVVDVSDGVPYKAAVGLGVLGAAALAYAVGRTVLPTVLFDGPSALKLPNQKPDVWAWVGRVIVILVSLCGLFALKSRTLPTLLKYGIAAVGVAFAGVFVVGSFTAPLTVAPKPYLVPGGLILAALGAAYLKLSLAVTSDSPLVVLTRREFAAFFFSPIVYIVLFGSAVAAGLGYWFFLILLSSAPAIPEPILANHDGLKIIAQIVVLFIVPALTMRAFSEEKRTGTLEVLLTAPVNEWTVVVSKFVPALAVFLLTWVPSAVYLIALWSVGGVPFDVRPLLSYYAAVAVSGASFIAMGIFFSSLTRNQVVAAVLTFAGMFSLLLVGFLARRLGALFKDLSREVSGGISELMTRVGYAELWDRALAGQLELPSVFLNLSLAALWLFLTTKVLEARKWS